MNNILQNIISLISKYYETFDIGHPFDSDHDFVKKDVSYRYYKNVLNAWNRSKRSSFLEKYISFSTLAHVRNILVKRWYLSSVLLLIGSTGNLHMSQGYWQFLHFQENQTRIFVKCPRSHGYGKKEYKNVSEWMKAFQVNQSDLWIRWVPVGNDTGFHWI